MSLKSKLHPVLIAILATTTILALYACGDESSGKNVAAINNVPPSADSATTTIAANDSLPPVEIWVNIEGCVCRKYSEFQVKWDYLDSSRVNNHALAELLIQADSSGFLLCDCSHGSGSAYVAVVESIDQLPNGVGLLVKLREQVYLDYADVMANLWKVLQSKEASIFYGNNFSI